MRVDAAPFDDVRVRQALRLIVDRQQMVDQVLGGHGPDRQRPVRAVRPGLRVRPAAARAGHRAGEVAAQAGRPGGPHRRAHDRGRVPGHRRGRPGVRRAGQGRRRHGQGQEGRLAARSTATTTSSGRSRRTSGATRVYLAQVAQGDAARRRRSTRRTGPTPKFIDAHPAGARRARRRQAQGDRSSRRRRSSTSRAATSSRASRTSSTRYSAKPGRLRRGEVRRSRFGNYWFKQRRRSSALARCAGSSSSGWPSGRPHRCWLVSLLVFAATLALPGDAATRHPRPRGDAGAVAALRDAARTSTSSVVSQYLALARRRAQRRPRRRRRRRQAPVVGAARRPRRQLASSWCSSRRSSRSRCRSALGCWMAMRRDRPADHVGSTLTLVLAALPEFVIGIGLVVLFATTVFNWFPAVSLLPPGRAPWDVTRRSWCCRRPRSCWSSCRTSAA